MLNGGTRPLVGHGWLHHDQYDKIKCVASLSVATCPGNSMSKPIVRLGNSLVFSVATSTVSLPLLCLNYIFLLAIVFIWSIALLFGSLPASLFLLLRRSNFFALKDNKWP